MLLLCSCGKTETTPTVDVYDSTLIDSLYYYFKQDTNDMLSLLYAPSDHMDEIKSKAESINFLTSAMIEELDSMPGESNTANKDHIIKSAEAFNDLLQSPSDANSRSSLVKQFNGALIETTRTVIGRRFELLDPDFGNISDKEVIPRDKLGEMCSSVPVTEYVVLPDQFEG